MDSSRPMHRIASGTRRSRDSGSPVPRPRRLRAIVTAVGASVLLLAGCGPSTASLADLALQAETYDGHEVVTYGVVAEFGEDDGALERHFVIRDADDNRVQLLPDELAEPHVGAAVQVTGEFRFDPEEGRALHVEVIEPAG